MSGLFGKLDVDNIPTNPFWIKAGTYDAVVQGVRKQQTREGRWKLVIRYAITEDGSEFYGNTAEEWIDFDPDMDEDTYESMSAEEKRALKRALSRIKNRLKMLGVPDLELGDPELDLESLTGVDVQIDIVNRGDDDEFVNVQRVKLAE